MSTLAPAQRKGLKVAQWRASHGPRGARLGWSTAEAASIVGIPTRTLQHWAADGFLRPTVPVELGIPKALYNSGDLVAARVLEDLTERGTPRVVLNLVAEDLAVWRGEVAIDVRKLAEQNWVLMVPVDEALATWAAENYDDGIISIHDAAEDMEGLGDYVTTLPISLIACEIAERADHWLDKAGIRHSKRLPWL